MIETALWFLHNATTLLFGVYISAAFVGIRMNRKNVLTLLGFSCAISVLSILSYLLCGIELTEKIYPLIIHLPLTLFLSFFFKYKFALCTLSVLTAYMCCQISNWVGLASLYITNSDLVYYSVRIIVTVTVFILLMRFIANEVSQLLQKPTKSIIILGLMPFVYYFFDYATGVYTGLLYSGLEVVVEFLGFVLCISYILFLFFYFKQYEQNLENEQRNRLMEMQQIQSQKEIKAIRRSEQAVSILRHDMRHFLLNISTFIDNGEIDKAQSYINEIIASADQTITQRYCKNEIVNMILSSHESEIKNNGIDFRYSINIPSKLPFSDVDLSSILSNGLENAIHAVLPLEESKRHINLDLHMNDNKMLISIKNTFAKKPKMIDDMPQADDDRHGFGTQSIRYVAEKLKGHCQFSVTGELFVLQVIL